MRNNDLACEKNYYRGAYALLIVTFIFLCVYISGHVLQRLDSDAASELVMGKVLAEEGCLISKNFFYSTEIRIIESNLIWMPLFSLFDSWYTIRLVGTVIMYIILLISLFLCCKVLKIQNFFPLIAVIWLLPISTIWFENVLLFVYYVPALVPACLSIFFLIKSTEGSKLSRTVAAVLGCFMALLLGMTSVRMAVTQYLPMLWAIVIYLWLNTEKDGRKAFNLIIMCCLPLLSALIGYVFNLKILSEQFSYESYSYLQFANLDIMRLEQYLASWLACLGYLEGPVFSDNLIYCAQSGILAVLGIYAVIYIILHREKYNLGAQFSAYFYLSSFTILCLVFTLSDMPFSDRYLISVCAFSFIPIFACFGNKKCFPYSGKYVMAFFMSVVLISSAFKYREMSGIDTNITKREAAEFLRKEGYNEGYASFWNANVITELSDGEVEIWSWPSDRVGDLYDVYEWLQPVSHCYETPGGKVFIMLSQSEIALEENFERIDCLSDNNIVFRTSEELLSMRDSDPHAYVIWGYNSFEELEEDFYS